MAGTMAAAMPPSDAGAAHALAYRVLLHHAGVTPQRQLARGACVCVAWRDAARAHEHNAVMRFDAAGPHVCAALHRCASAVQELHVPALTAPLPEGVCFPRLTLVDEYDSQPPDLTAAAEAHDNAVSVVARAPVVVAALRAAPRLQRWLLRSAADVVPSALSHALTAGVAAERTACRCLRFRCCIPAVADAVRDVLPPQRAVTDVHACFTACSTPPGAGVLHCLMRDMPPKCVARMPRWAGVRQSTDVFYQRQIDYLSVCSQALRVQAQAAAVAQGNWYWRAHLTWFTPSDSAVDVELRRLTLLHQAVACASLGAAAVLLRAGADPLREPDDAQQRRSLANNNCGSSALALAAADVSALLAYADRLPRDDGGDGSWLTRLAVRLAPARATAPRAVAMLWLLGRAAAARHGDNALAAVMPPAALAVLRAAPHAVPGLSAGGRVASLGVARAARALLVDAEAFTATGDASAAARAFCARRARAAACAVLGATLVTLAAVPVLALAAATTAPFAALALPAAALILLARFLMPVRKFARKAAAVMNRAAFKAAKAGYLLMVLLIRPVCAVAALWLRVCAQLASLADSLFSALSRG
jgi:hypothetical protein